MTYSIASGPASRSSRPLGTSSSSSASTTSASARATRTARRITEPAGPATRRARSPCQRALQLREHPLVGAQVVVGHRAGEALEEVALLARQPARDRDVDDYSEVAGAPALQRRQAAAAHDDRLTRLRAGRDLERDRPVERRDVDRRAERRRRRRDVDHRHEVLAVAQEALVLAHAHHHVEVAGRPTALARVPPAGDPDALAVRDPGRDVDAHRAVLDPVRAAAAHLARLLGHAAVAAAHVADPRSHELAEARAGNGLDLAGALAARAGDDRRARLGPVAVAVVAQDLGLVGDLDGRSVRGVGELDTRRHDDVAALDPAALAAGAERRIESAGAEERREDVRERAEALEVRRIAARAQAVLPVCVVQAPALGVRENL